MIQTKISRYLSPVAASAASRRCWRCGSAASTPSFSSRPRPSARSAPASRSAPTPRASCARSGSARRSRAPALLSGRTRLSRLGRRRPPLLHAARRSGRRRISARRTTRAPRRPARRAARRARQDGFRLGARIERFDQDRGPASPSRSPTARLRPATSSSAPTASTRRCAGSCSGKELPRYTGNVAWRGLVPAERVAHLDRWPRHRRLDGTEPQHRAVLRCGRRDLQLDRHQPLRAAGAGIWLAEGRIEDALAEYSGWHTTIRTIIAATPTRAAAGAVRPRAAAGLAGRACRAPGRCRAPDDAVLRPGRRSEHRGRLCAGGLPRGEPGRTEAALNATSSFASRAPRGCRTYRAARKNSTR